MITYFICNRNSTLPIDILDYQNDGAYDVTVSSLFSESELPSRTIFFCELIIPNTPYNITKRFIYNPGKKNICKNIKNLKSISIYRYLRLIIV